MGFESYYLAEIKKHQFEPSSHQKAIFNHFDAIKEYHSRSKLQSFFSPKEYGLYIWGDVGRGKSFLTEMFLKYLGQPYRRYHLHELMQMLEKKLSQNNSSNALSLWIKQLKKKCKIIYIDEFVVNDIATAMQLQKILKTLAKEKMLVFMTSNFKPESLYKGGLHRQRFIPTITFIENHYRVIELGGDIDYRFKALKNYAHKKHDTESIKQLFIDIAPAEMVFNADIEILHRTVVTKGLSDSLVWLDFTTLFGDGRSTNDYLEIAQRFQTMIIDKTPSMLTDDDIDIVRRLIHGIDAFYEANVKVIWEELIGDVYQGEKLYNEWVRCQSRLKLMQTEKYWQQAHLSR